MHLTGGQRDRIHAARKKNVSIKIFITILLFSNCMLPNMASWMHLLLFLKLKIFFNFLSHPSVRQHRNKANIKKSKKVQSLKQFFSTLNVLFNYNNKCNEFNRFFCWFHKNFIFDSCREFLLHPATAVISLFIIIVYSMAFYACHHR